MEVKKWKERSMHAQRWVRKEKKKRREEEMESWRHMLAVISRAG
jgi:hypothetical protein